MGTFTPQLLYQWFGNIAEEGGGQIVRLRKPGSLQLGAPRNSINKIRKKMLISTNMETSNRANFRDFTLQ